MFEAISSDETDEGNNQNNIFIAKQPIIDKNLELYGYEIFSRMNEIDDFYRIDLEQSTNNESKMLFNILSTFDIVQILGGKYAFINCNIESLNIDCLELISPKMVVLEIQKPIITDTSSLTIILQKIQYLKQNGYMIACNDFIFENPFLLWINYVDIIKLQSSKDTSHNIDMIKKAQLFSKKIVAEMVESQEQYQFFLQNNVDLFQGYFFCKPVTMGAKITNPLVINLIELMNLIIQDADIHHIEKILKNDPSLSYKLLKYINSAGFGLSRTITSFKQAILILGSKKLFKWSTLLLSHTNTNPGSDMITKMAVSRAKFMELMGEHLYTKEDADYCFVIGMFSLLDVMLNVPFRVAMDSISLSESISDALLYNKGKYAPLLQLTIALENNNWIDILSLAHQLGLNSQIITQYHLDAIKWSNQININT